MTWVEKLSLARNPHSGASLSAELALRKAEVDEAKAEDEMAEWVKGLSVTSDDSTMLRLEPVKVMDLEEIRAQRRRDAEEIEMGHALGVMPPEMGWIGMEVKIGRFLIETGVTGSESEAKHIAKGMMRECVDMGRPTLKLRTMLRPTSPLYNPYMFVGTILSNERKESPFYRIIVDQPLAKQQWQAWVYEATAFELTKTLSEKDSSQGEPGGGAASPPGGGPTQFAS